MRRAEQSGTSQAVAGMQDARRKKDGRTPLRPCSGRRSWQLGGNARRANQLIDVNLSCRPAMCSLVRSWWSETCAGSVLRMCSRYMRVHTVLEQAMPMSTGLLVSENQAGFWGGGVIVALLGAEFQRGYPNKESDSAPALSPALQCLGMVRCTYCVVRKQARRLGSQQM